MKLIYFSIKKVTTLLPSYKSKKKIEKIKIYRLKIKYYKENNNNTYCIMYFYLFYKLIFCVDNDFEFPSYTFH
jgi:hypothetical protein